MSSVQLNEFHCEEMYFLSREEHSKSPIKGSYLVSERGLIREGVFHTFNIKKVAIHIT